ncbi:MAG: RNase H family protein [Pirellulales bacterium]|nr:RNase H family protein [Pirellulales bacterium]
MRTQRPHYLLHTQTSLAGARGNWQFTLRGTNGGGQLEVSETEEIPSRERLELLAVVRGLESVPQPARVTLVTDSQYVRQGIRHGLEEWRANQWHWEAFGELVPIKNLDLWRRVDRALQCHQVEFKYWRIDAAHESFDDASRQTAGANATISVVMGQHSPRPRHELVTQPEQEPVLPTLGRCRTAHGLPSPTEQDEFAEYEAGYQIWQPTEGVEERLTPSNQSHRVGGRQHAKNRNYDGLASLAFRTPKRPSTVHWRTLCPSVLRRRVWLIWGRTGRRIQELGDSLVWFLHHCGVKQVWADLCGFPQHHLSQHR